MSDYPRPVLPPPPKPYGPDRVVAIAFAILVLLSTVFWFAGALRRPGAEQVEQVLSRWWGYYVAYLVAHLLYGWMFYGLAKSRFWAFMTTLPLVSLSIVSNVVTHDVVRAAFGFVLVAYTIARLFGFLGPRPLRRLDVRPG